MEKSVRFYGSDSVTLTFADKFNRIIINIAVSQLRGTAATCWRQDAAVTHCWWELRPREDQLLPASLLLGGLLTLTWDASPSLVTSLQ